MNLFFIFNAKIKEMEIKKNMIRNDHTLEELRILKYNSEVDLDIYKQFSLFISILLFTFTSIFSLVTFKNSFFEKKESLLRIAFNDNDPQWIVSQINSMEATVEIFEAFWIMVVICLVLLFLIYLLFYKKRSLIAKVIEQSYEEKVNLEDVKNIELSKMYFEFNRDL